MLIVSIATKCRPTTQTRNWDGQSLDRLYRVSVLGMNKFNENALGKPIVICLCEVWELAPHCSTMQRSYNEKTGHSRKRLWRECNKQFIVCIQSLVLKFPSGIIDTFLCPLKLWKTTIQVFFYLNFDTRLLNKTVLANAGSPCCLLELAHLPLARSAAVGPCYTATARVSRLSVIGSLTTLISVRPTRFDVITDTFKKRRLGTGGLVILTHRIEMGGTKVENVTTGMSRKGWTLAPLNKKHLFLLITAAIIPITGLLLVKNTTYHPSASMLGTYGKSQQLSTSSSPSWVLLLLSTN